MTRRAKPARYRLAAHPAVPDDLDALAAYGPEVVSAARTALDDLAHGRVMGKALGDRHVSGDLTGLARPCRRGRVARHERGRCPRAVANGLASAALESGRRHPHFDRSAWGRVALRGSRRSAGKVLLAWPPAER